MNLLLDTHIFIWWDSQSASLSRSARALCDDPNNTLYLSLTSVWEMQIKQQLGKLDLSRPLAVLIAEQQKSTVQTIHGAVWAFVTRPLNE